MSDLSRDNLNKKARLGRGLGSLLGAQIQNQESAPKAGANIGLNTQDTQRDIQNSQKPHQSTPTQAIPPDARVWKVAIDKLHPGQFQPRTNFEKEKLEELAASIRANGVLQPIVARKRADGKFEIIAGERRWRAAQIAGLHEVPVLLKEMENQVALELAIIENIQREDLNPIEEGLAYQRLIEEFGLTQQQVADKVGKDRATIANAIRVLSLPKEIKDHILSGELSLGHAKVLLSLLDPRKQLALCRQAMQQKMSVRQLEKLVNKAKEERSPEIISMPSVSEKLISGLSEELQKKLGTKVAIDYSEGKGKISVYFYSDDELTQLVDRLKSGRH